MGSTCRHRIGNITLMRTMEDEVSLRQNKKNVSFVSVYISLLWFSQYSVALETIIMQDRLSIVTSNTPIRLRTNLVI